MLTEIQPNGTIKVTAQTPSDNIAVNCMIEMMRTNSYLSQEDREQHGIVLDAPYAMNWAIIPWEKVL